MATEAIKIKDLLLTDFDAKQVLIEAVPKMIVDRDTQRIVWANHKFDTLFGCHITGELIGELMEECIPERYREKHRGNVEEFWAAPAVRLMSTRILECRRRDATEFTAQILLVPCKPALRISCLVQFMSQEHPLDSGILS